MLGLLDDAGDPVLLVEGRHAQVAEVLLVVGRGEQDPGTVGVGPEGVHHGPDRVLADVVGQHHQHRVTVDEPGGQAQCLGDPTRTLLVAVAELVDPELVAVAEQA